MNNLSSPITFKKVKNLVPFVGDAFVFNKGYDTVIGTDLQLYNLLTLDITVKSAITTVGGIGFIVTGSTRDDETSTAVYVDGVLEERNFDSKSRILDAGKYKITYDISAIKKGYLWIHANTYSDAIKVSDVVDIRVSVQNSENLPRESKAISKILYSRSDTKGNTYSRTVNVAGLDTIRLKIKTYKSESTGYFNLSVHGSNSNETTQGLPLYDINTKKILSKHSMSIGYNWKIEKSSIIDVLVDVSDYQSLILKWERSNDDTIIIPYDILLVESAISIDSIIDKTIYTTKSFRLENCEIFSDCYWDTFIKVNSNRDTIYISTSGYGTPYKDIAFNASNFPNMKDGSRIFNAWVLPYSYNSSATTGTYARVCIISDKGQVYHNFPNRPNGAIGGDEYRFDESAIWDLPVGRTTRRHPSKNENESKTGYRFDPSLPDYAYELVPGVNQDNGYGNGGFGATIGTGQMTRPRFYSFGEPYRVNNNDSSKLVSVDNPFRILSYPTKTRKMTFLGTYQINRQRVCLFGTPDGGRNWYVLAEFTSNVGWGNTINTSLLDNYSINSFSIKKRSYIYPNDETKEPENLFTFGSSIKVTSITNTNPAIVTTATSHGLNNMDVIVFNKDTEESSSFDFMTNNGANENISGNGMFYMIERIDNTSFKLREFIYNPDTNLITRHVHSTNALKDFISVCCGETHPEGWITLLDQREKDSYADVDPKTNWFDLYRLNSGKKSVQRLCSFWMLDDDAENPTVFCGMDEVGIERPKLKVTGRTNMPKRSSAGIMKGKLSDIDDMSKFVSVLDVEDVNIYCVDFNGILVAGFQMGHCAVSLDGGDTWEIINRGSMPQIAGVDKSNTIYFNNGSCLKLR